MPIIHSHQNEQVVFLVKKQKHLHRNKKFITAETFMNKGFQETITTS